MNASSHRPSRARAPQSRSNPGGPSRRRFLRGLMVGAGLTAVASPPFAARATDAGSPATGQPYPSAAPAQGRPPQFKTRLRITRLETLLVKPRWLFLKIHTDEGLVGLGEPILEGRAKTVIPHPIQKDGWLDVPTAPGLGVDIDEDFVRQWPSEMNVSVPVTEQSGAYAEGTFAEHVYVQTRVRRGSYFKGS